MAENNATNTTTPFFVRCLGVYHINAAPTQKILVTYLAATVILSLLSVLSSLGNGIIIYVYLKDKSLQKSNIFLLMCLAFLDFLTGAVMEPLYVVRLMSEIHGFTSCVYVFIVRRFFEYLRPVSFITLALITIERYLALFKPVTHRRLVTKTRLLYAVLLTWLVWFVVICIRSLFPGVTFAFYGFFTFVALSLLAVNIGMYFMIGKLARFHSRSVKPTVQYSTAVDFTEVVTVNIRNEETNVQPMKEISVQPQNTTAQVDDTILENTPQPKTVNKTPKLLIETRERNATRTVFYIVLVLTVCYLPISALLMYISFQKDLDANLLFIYFPISETIALFNALINPFIYCLRNRKMRAAVLRLFQFQT